MSAIMGSFNLLLGLLGTIVGAFDFYKSEYFLALVMFLCAWYNLCEFVKTIMVKDEK